MEREIRDRIRCAVRGEDQAMGMKLNLGAGGNILAGWHNHDLDMDITKRLPFDDNTIDAIFIEHCLEHVHLHDAMRFLEEAHRVLVPGGMIRITVPSIVKAM